MRIIDLDSWPRKQHFQFFQSRRNPLLSVTAPVEVKTLLDFRKKQGAAARRFTDCIYYAIMRSVNAVPEFRMRIVDLRPVEFERIDAGFTYRPSDSALHYNCVAAFDEDFSVFSANIQKAREKADAYPTLTPKGAEGQNLIYMTCLPDIAFTSFSNPWGDPWSDTVPRIAFGKADAKSRAMPVAIEALHSFIDGSHLSAFLLRMSEILEHPADFFSK